MRKSLLLAAALVAVSPTSAFAAERGVTVQQDSVLTIKGGNEKLVVGQKTKLTLTFKNNGDGKQTPDVTLQVPTGLAVEKSEPALSGNMWDAGTVDKKKSAKLELTLNATSTVEKAAFTAFATGYQTKPTEVTFDVVDSKLGLRFDKFDSVGGHKTLATGAVGFGGSVLSREECLKKTKTFNGKVFVSGKRVAQITKPLTFSKGKCAWKVTVGPWPPKYRGKQVRIQITVKVKAKRGEGNKTLRDYVKVDGKDSRKIT